MFEAAQFDASELSIHLRKDGTRGGLHGRAAGNEIATDPAAKPLNHPFSAASASTMPMPIQTSFEMVGRAPVDQLRSVAGRGSATLPLTTFLPLILRAA
ncbi:MAG: hypothetical protein EBZ76_02220 [Synechococcaceae bacterium WB9_2_170]|nr:hypothetical protein [Synechococcaceae bacterium WB9_2_170]